MFLMCSSRHLSNTMNLNLNKDGRVEQLCEHGVGHIIAIPRYAVERIEARRSLMRRNGELIAWFIHDCDGCCVLVNRRCKRL